MERGGVELLLLLLLVGDCGGDAEATHGGVVVGGGAPLATRVPLGGAGRWSRFAIDGAKPGVLYEAKASFSGPAAALVELALEGNARPAGTRLGGRRRLLDVEKVEFVGRGRPEVLLVRASPLGVPRDGPAGTAETLAIVLGVGEVWAGVPAEAYPVAALALALVALAAAFAPRFAALQALSPPPITSTASAGAHVD